MESVQELKRDELVVVAGVLRVMMMADAKITTEELRAVTEIGRRLGLGEAEWESIWDEASRTLPSPTAVREAAARLERETAREAVYELLYELADSDTIADEEWDLLEWLDETWLASPGRRSRIRF
jgi:uncharacterized tellurite resistance protein B-like protein